MLYIYSMEINNAQDILVVISTKRGKPCGILVICI
jgi:hypothetical protein